MLFVLFDFNLSHIKMGRRQAKSLFRFWGIHCIKVSVKLPAKESKTTYGQQFEDVGMITFLLSRQLMCLLSCTWLDDKHTHYSTFTAHLSISLHDTVFILR